ILADLKKIIGYIEVLQKIDTENVPPCNHVIEDMHNVFREDVVGETMDQELFLNNAPSHSGKFIRVPPVIKSS
ncbi:MAG: Asp-tRNA(Asn)/Glu-tRNA(Gln) amidotransferase subunit GatC, partial [Parachlamydiaceae bacterium]|nr:Asp-tRNA(Asn)/Glu-tRNA(Gln) amidotransferase subunit GatC [Parachlamydiaceae bacterium]